MFDIGWSEMLVIAIVVIVVVGPKELPGMLRTFGKTTAKLRVMANDFRRQFDEAMKEADLGDVKKIADDMRKLNPASEVRKALSPMEKAARDVRSGLDAAMKPGAGSAAQPAAAATPAPVAVAEVAANPAAATPAPASAAARAASAKPAAVAKPAASAKPKPAASAKPAAVKPAPKPRAAAKPKPAAKPKAASRPKSGGAAS